LLVGEPYRFFRGLKTGKKTKDFPDNPVWLEELNYLAEVEVEAEFKGRL